MSPVQLIALWRVESRKLLSRTLGRVGLVLAVLLGLAGPLWLHMIANTGAEFNNSPVSGLYAFSGADAVLWALWFRNLLIMRVLLVALTALAFAGEFHSRTLRDALVQPVPRWSVVIAKWLAVGTWLTVGMALTWGTGMVLGCILFGTDGPWADAATATAVTLLCDAGFAALALAAAILLRSTIGALLAMLAFMVVDRFVGFVLWAIESFAQAQQMPWALEVAIQAQPWLPSSAYGAWTAWTGGNPAVWQHYAALLMYTVVALGLSTARFQRMDVP